MKEKSPPTMLCLITLALRAAMLPRKPGEWESLDVTLVGRTVTVVRDGTLTIDHKEINGITGGALDANEGAPGSFYI